MTYVTKQQLVDRFTAEKMAQLTDRFGDGDLDNDVLAEAIADADRTIDAYVSPRHTLPLTQAMIDASPLVRIAGDLVIYFLQGDLSSEDADRRYKDAMQFLRDVQSGKASLGAQDAITPTSGHIETRCGESQSYDWGSY